MKRLWFGMLLILSALVVVDIGFSALRWMKVDSCLDRGQSFDYSRQACTDAEDSALLHWWQANQVAVRSARAFVFAGFFTLSVVLIRRNRVAT